jgi:hypothetical protein
MITRTPPARLIALMVLLLVLAATASGRAPDRLVGSSMGMVEVGPTGGEIGLVDDLPSGGSAFWWMGPGSRTSEVQRSKGHSPTFILGPIRFPVSHWPPRPVENRMSRYGVLKCENRRLSVFGVTNMAASIGGFLPSGGVHSP